MSTVQQNASSEQQDFAATPAVANVDEAAIRALLGGEIGRELGLTGSDLRIGLTVAKNLLARGAQAEALRVYVALVLCEPTNVDFQVGLAHCASVLGEHHLALQAASAVIALAPRDPRGYLLSGRSCLAIGHLTEAREDFGDVLRLAADPSHRAVQREATLLLDRLSAMQG